MKNAYEIYAALMASGTPPELIAARLFGEY